MIILILIDNIDDYVKLADPDDNDESNLFNIPLFFNFIEYINKYLFLKILTNIIYLFYSQEIIIYLFIFYFLTQKIIFVILNIKNKYYLAFFK